MTAVFGCAHQRNNRGPSNAPITVGINNGVYMEIVSGLSGNEEVVRSLTTALSNGEQVRTVLDSHYHLGFQPELVKTNRN